MENGVGDEEEVGRWRDEEEDGWGVIVPRDDGVSVLNAWVGEGGVSKKNKNK